MAGEMVRRKGVASGGDENDGEKSNSKIVDLVNLFECM